MLSAHGKRKRSPDVLAVALAAVATADGAPLRKLACTLFNQGLRRRTIPCGQSVQGLRARADSQGGGEDEAGCRSEACGLFNGALRPHPAAADADALLLDRDGQVLVTQMAAQRRRIAGQFAVLGEVGRGAFGVCVKAWDTASQTPVAIKIVRRGNRHRLDAVMEGEKLEILRWRDPQHKFCVRAISVCEYQGHFCLVTELLGSNLLAALRELCAQGSSGVRVDMARRIAAQLCAALDFLRQSRLIHADLKTENICLARPGSAASAARERPTHGPHLQHAPHVLRLAALDLRRLGRVRRRSNTAGWGVAVSQA